VLDTKLDGKSFSRLDEFDETSFYSKMIFADRVVRANVSTINFGEFRELFDRIKAAIVDYAVRLTKP
jgi:uncharacterized RDD family membrane protein YckC